MLMRRSSAVATFRGGVMSKRVLLTGISLALLVAGSVERAESQQYVSTTAFRVPFTRMDSLQKLLKATKAVDQEAKRRGGVVDNVWLIHAWGGEYNVLNITTWKSWAAIQDTALGFDAATRKVYPDSVQRKRIDDSFNWVFEGQPHVDNIYRKAE
jgi:hypothetical protein